MDQSVTFGKRVSACNDLIFLGRIYVQWCDVSPPGEPTRKNWPIRFISPHHRVSLKIRNWFLNWLNKRKLNIVKHENKSYTYFLTLFYRIEVDVECEMLEKLMLTSCGKMSVTIALGFTGQYAQGTLLLTTTSINTMIILPVLLIKKI